MLDEIREQRFLACHLRIEGVLITGARSLHGAGLTGRGTRQLRPPPISSESLTIGGMGRGFGWRRGQIAIVEGVDSALGLIAVSGRAYLACRRRFQELLMMCSSIGPGQHWQRYQPSANRIARRLKAAPSLGPR
ncbi:hypothetical protein A9976_04370 [Delftia sp. UME58]|nr:hypothetical protein [Delftia sp. UME58]